MAPGSARTVWSAPALVTERKEFPDNSLIVGTPAKVLRTLTEQDIAGMHKNAAEYVERGHAFKAGLKQIA
jgi:carbonic anhydrase/acetyltransferase-like protein (isoleucine patch superfamily)